MTPARLAVLRAERRLIERLDRLEEQLASGEESAWPAYCEAAAALAAIAPLTVPGAGGELLTTEQMAAQFGLKSKAFLRKVRKGQLPLEPLRLAQRGSAALRWGAR